MLRYFIRRLLLIIPTFLGITIVVFVVTRLVPGGPLEEAIRSRQMGFSAEGGTPGGTSARRSQSGLTLSEAQLLQLKKFYGLDRPIVPAYFAWLGKLLRLDFGKSTRYGDPVLPMILERVPVSLYFGVASLLITYLLSVPLGISKALKHRSLYDNVTSTLVFVGYALPGYIVGIVLLSVFSFRLGWLPLGGFQSPFFDDMGLLDRIGDRAAHMVLPLAAYVIGDFAVMTLMMKNNLMENMAADYIKTAVAKGRTFREAMWFHAFRNSLIPIASGFGSIITVFLAGSFLVENIFNIRGMGMLGYTALMNQDYPVVLGTLAIAAFASLLGNVLSDFFVSLVDPRIRFGQ
jgi:microcin C transport system permease protein